MLKYLSVLVIIFFLGSGIGDDQAPIVRKNQRSVTFEGVKIMPHIIEFRDTIQNDTLFEVSSISGLPVYYFRKIATGVCAGEECRMVRITLLWDITGRYLGFELPPGEFFSKTKHTPFRQEEYDRLHRVLGDHNSPLSRYTIDELAPKKVTTPGLDAVTSATILDVLDHIVPGAVYTTYTLWHLANGQAKAEAEKITLSRLNPQLISEILNSPLTSDKIWMLNHISPGMDLGPDIINKILDYINTNDIYLSERALNAIPLKILSEEAIQMQLLSVFDQTGFIQKKLILQKLKESSSLSASLVKGLASEMTGTNGSLVVIILDLFKKNQISDSSVLATAMELLENENRFVAGRAYQFLNAIPEKSKEVESRLRKFEKQR